MCIDLFPLEDWDVKELQQENRYSRTWLFFTSSFTFFFGGGDKRETNGNRLNKKNVEDAEKRSNTVPRA